jgi:hypothetical protein
MSVRVYFYAFCHCYKNGILWYREIARRKKELHIGKKRRKGRVMGEKRSSERQEKSQYVFAQLSVIYRSKSEFDL